RVRGGAPWLFEPDRAGEEAEPERRAGALRETLAGAAAPSGQERPAGPVPAAPAAGGLRGEDLRVLLVDHQDSFVHTLAGYFAEQGARVTTLRAGFPAAALAHYRPDLVVLAPGPGRPSAFACARL